MHHALFQRAQRLESFLNGASLLEMISRSLEKLACTHHQRSLGFVNPLYHALLVPLKECGDIECSPGW
jgi:hypothetical protein